MNVVLQDCAGVAEPSVIDNGRGMSVCERDRGRSVVTASGRWRASPGGSFGAAPIIACRRSWTEGITIVIGALRLLRSSSPAQPYCWPAVESTQIEVPAAGYVGEDGWALVMVHPVKQVAREDGLRDGVAVDASSNFTGNAKVITELRVEPRPGIVSVTCEPDPRHSRAPQPSLKVVR